ncbi:MAG: hypothetical protein RLZZ76_758 [Candidatus Parcubacteria bacterium]|jgi:hypothetical protein
MTLEEMREAVLEKRPNFKKVLDLWGGKTLLDYYTQNFENLGTPSQDFLSALHTETKLLFGEGIAAQTVTAIKNKRWVNTADHHGLLCHPYFYSAALARSHKSVRGEDTVTLTLPFSSVSLSNDSFPRGFFFHDSEGAVQKIFFKSLKDKRMPVYALPPLTEIEYLHAIRHYAHFPLSKNASLRLTSFLETLETHEPLWSQTSYNAQLTLMNALLWKHMFGDERGEFVYIPIEDIVVRLLLEKHLVQETILHHVLFDPLWRSDFLPLFFGESQNHKGTEIFWFIDYTERCSRPLVVHGDTLTTKEGDVTIPLTPEAIAKGLKEKTLMPSTALMMILLQGEEGVACGGGPSQLEYLDTYMKKWSALLTKHSITSTIPNTQIWCADNTLFQIHTSALTTKSSLATLIDLLLYKITTEEVDSALTSTHIEKTVAAMTPTLYAMYTQTNKQESVSYNLPIIIPQP